MRDYRKLDDEEKKKVDCQILKIIKPSRHSSNKSRWEWDEPYWTLNNIHIGKYCADCLKAHFMCKCAPIIKIKINKEMELIEKGIYLNKENRQKYILLSFGKAHFLHNWTSCVIYQKLEKDQDGTLYVIPTNEFLNSFEDAVHFCRCEHLDLNPSECVNFSNKTFKCKYDL